MSKLYTFSEVSKHNNQNSTWIVIHNGVYDVTKYLNEHPGGEEPLLAHAGIDGTNDFEDVGHSEDAREIMKKYKIGELAPGEKNKISSAKQCFPWKYALLALAGALVVGFVVKKYVAGGSS